MLGTSTRSGFRGGCGRASWRPPSDLVLHVHVSGALSGACTGKEPQMANPRPTPKPENLRPPWPPAVHLISISQDGFCTTSLVQWSCDLARPLRTQASSCENSKTSNFSEPDARSVAGELGLIEAGSGRGFLTRLASVNAARIGSRASPSGRRPQPPLSCDLHLNHAKSGARSKAVFQAHSRIASVIS